MTVNTKEVTGRRTLSYSSYDDFLADVDSLAASETEVVGNWSYAQVCKHLAAALNASIDGASFRAPWPMRMLAKLLIKKKLLTQKIPAGFQIPGTAKKQFEPQEPLDLQEQLTALHAAVERVKSEKSRASHPMFDRLTTEEWDQFNLRHAELHMSFVKPVSGGEAKT